MKLINTLILASLCWASSASAALVLKTEGLACTEDYNEWGHGSFCPCPESSVYNKKVGECLVGDPWPILVQGTLLSKNATGPRVALATKFGRFELLVKRSEVEKLRRAHGLSFEVSGEFILLQGKDKKDQPTIIVDTLSWLE